MLTKLAVQVCSACCLAVLLPTCSVVGQAKSTRADEQTVNCSIKVDPARIVRGRPVSVEISIENVSRLDINLEAVCSFDLLKIADESIARNFSVIGDSYWSPFDISSGTPLKLHIIEPEMLKKGIVVGRAPKDKLHLSIGEGKTFKVELTKLLWNASVLSGWPKADLFDVVPKGRYWLVLRIRGDEEIKSNKVEVSVE